MWRNIHLASGKTPAKKALHPDPTSEANRLVDGFAQRSNSEQLPQETREKQQQLEQQRADAVRTACLEDAPTDTPFTREELEATLQPRKDTAAGSDKITYSMIRRAGTPAQEELLRVINKSYETGKLPKTWKEANIVPIPKQNDPGSHRPLTPQLSGENSRKDGAVSTSVDHRDPPQTFIRLHFKQVNTRLHHRNDKHHSGQKSHYHIHGPRESV